MRVLCVKWGDKYGPEYVTRLKSAVAKHLPIEHDFVCITDKPVDGVTCIPFESKFPTWWSKIELFKPGKFPGANLYFDLDVVITGDLIGFVRGPGKLWALDDFSYSLRNHKNVIDLDTKRLLGGAGTCNSSVMFWHDDEGRKVWDSFTPEVMKRLHGDQNHITQALYPHSLELYPPRLACSYKYHVQRGDPHGSVCVFHGNPKAPDLSRSDPMRKLWEAA